MSIESYCGLVGTTCKYRSAGQSCKEENEELKEAKKEVCSVENCAKSKSIRFCGECWEFPCVLFNEELLDEDDNVEKRVKQCEKWRTQLVEKAREGIDLVSICGHHCGFCFMGYRCGSCRSTYNCCSYATISENGICPNVKCADEHGLDGCYDCPELKECKVGYYSKEYNGEKEYTAKATAMFIHKYGKQKFTETIQKAIDSGVAYAKDFDETGSVEAALAKLEYFL